MTTSVARKNAQVEAENDFSDEVEEEEDEDEDPDEFSDQLDTTTRLIQPASYNRSLLDLYSTFFPFP